MRKIYIYSAMISPCVSTDGEYQMDETDLCEYGDEWRGDVRGYIENLYAEHCDSEPEIRDESALGPVRQNFGGLDPIPGSILVVYHDGAPESVYWASEELASWADQAEDGDE